MNGHPSFNEYGIELIYCYRQCEYNQEKNYGVHSNGLSGGEPSRSSIALAVRNGKLCDFTMDCSLAIRVASYNIRYDRISDSITVQQSLGNLSDPLQQPNYLRSKGEQPWSKRRIPVAEQILSMGTIVAGQDLLTHSTRTRRNP